MKNNLPAGYVSRPATKDDLPGVVEMINASSMKTFGVAKFTLDEYRLDWELERFNLETDTRLVLSPQGKMAGVLEYWDLYDPHVRYQVWGRVHPEHEGIGVGSHLLAWADDRAQRSLPAAPQGARVVLQSFVPSIYEKAGPLFVSAGYRLIRTNWRMVMSLNGAPPAPVWPEGITVRSMRLGDEEARVLQAVRESFKDHFGYVESPFEQEYERWMHMIQNDVNFDASLWFLALDGDEIAGMSLCWPKAYEDADMGWVSTLGVRRAWRRRGLGLALLQHSIAEFHRHGKARVGLGVDAESLTGATQLYLKAGMQPDPRFQFSLYEMELRTGLDLITQSLD